MTLKNILVCILGVIIVLLSACSCASGDPSALSDGVVSNNISDSGEASNNLGVYTDSSTTSGSGNANTEENTTMGNTNNQITTSNGSVTENTANTTTTTKSTTNKPSTTTTKTTSTTAVKSDTKTYPNGNKVKQSKTGDLDFIMEVPAGRDITVLQLTDPQIADVHYEDRCFKYIRETIKKSNPDLILITGDIVYGNYDPNGNILKAFIQFMEDFNIPWAPIYGNHDAESAMGVDWQCQQYAAAENCLFVQRELTGNGNYTIGICQDGTVKRVFFMMDSNTYTKTTYANAHSVTTTGIQQDQKIWFADATARLKTAYPNVKFTIAFHVQIYNFLTAFQKYGFTSSGTLNNPINLDTLSGVAGGDFGYLGRDMKSPWYGGTIPEGTFYDIMKQRGVDTILCGHEHCNSASVAHEGIRFQYGQKSSVYDRTNYLTANGTIVGAYVSENKGTPIVGGTVLKLFKTDSAIKDAYIQYWDK